MKMRSGPTVAEPAGGAIDLDAYLRRIGLDRGSRPRTSRGLRDPARGPLRGHPVREPRHPPRPAHRPRSRRAPGQAGGRPARRLLLRAEHALRAPSWRRSASGSRRLAARVRANTTELRPRTHMLLRVDLPEGPFVADVGFGGRRARAARASRAGGREVFAEPREAPGAVGHRIVREGGEVRVLQAVRGGAWKDLYAFTLEPQHAGGLRDGQPLHEHLAAVALRPEPDRAAGAGGTGAPSCATATSWSARRVASRPRPSATPTTCSRSWPRSSTSSSLRAPGSRSRTSVDTSDDPLGLVEVLGARQTSSVRTEFLQEALEVSRPRRGEASC